jgi:hypothetical protein
VGACQPNKWLVYLQGGGSTMNPINQGLDTGAFVYDRWCGVEDIAADRLSTSFNTPNLVDGSAMAVVRGDDAVTPDAFFGWNVVAVRYCTQDEWSGAARDVPMEASGVAFTGNYTGRKVLMGVLDELDEGVSYTGCDGAQVDLPALVDAEEVVFAGASAGMAGVVNNLDAMAERRFRRQRYGDGASDPFPRVRGLIDAGFVPNERLSWDEAVRTACAPDEDCDFEEHLAELWTVTEGADWWGANVDESCYRYHQADVDGPGVGWCADPTHVVENHLATEFFLRHSLNDDHVGWNTVDNELALTADSLSVLAGQAPEGVHLSDDEDGDGDVLELFALEVREQMINLRSATWQAPEEPTAGGDDKWVYGSYCSGHEGLIARRQMRGHVVNVGGVPYTAEAAVIDWLADGSGPREILADPNDPTSYTCEE